MPAPSPLSVSVAKTLPRGIDVVVVGLADDGLRGVPDDLGTRFSKRFGVSVAEMARSLGAKPAAGSARTLPSAGDGPRIVVVGLGTGRIGLEQLRRAAGEGVRSVASLAEVTTLSAAISLGTSGPDEALAVVDGALLGSYRYTRGALDESSAGTVDRVAVLHAGHLDARPVSDRVTVARGVYAAREWINLPGNLLHPESFSEQVRALVADSKVSVDVLDDKALAKGGYGGLTAVGGGSARPPRLVRLSYAPRGAKTHLALVGKGITFDSGGLNLKPGDGMYTMKCDMSGAAAVLAATYAIATLGLKVKVTAYGALAENMPSGSAYRPSDVLTIYGGKTVENGNSDAEGRLVMADALARSAEDKPDLVIDVATLTGSCVVALGERTAGVMANDQSAADRVLEAARMVGEDMWQLPILDELRAKLESKVADLRSTGNDRWAGAQLAAAFLREFVPAGTPWVHLDIAGPAFHTGAPYGYITTGGTGVGVRTLVEVARSLS